LKGVLKNTVLGLQWFRGRHTAENQGESFWAIVQKFKIEGNRGYFLLDNATNNDTAMRWIALKLHKMGIRFDPVKGRLRYLGYIISLVVKVFLWGDDPEIFEHETDTLQSMDGKEAELQLWRNQGPLGKLHNIIVWIG
jgi:hypothetical protein